jgi:hypothetical protein
VVLNSYHAWRKANKECQINLKTILKWFSVTWIFLSLWLSKSLKERGEEWSWSGLGGNRISTFLGSYESLPKHLWYKSRVCMTDTRALEGTHRHDTRGNSVSTKRSIVFSCSHRGVSPFVYNVLVYTNKPKTAKNKQNILIRTQIVFSFFNYMNWWGGWV